MTAEEIIEHTGITEIAEDFLMANGVPDEFARAVYAHPYALNENYLIRTVTFVYLGRVVAVTGQEVVLEDAAWIPETDRFHESFLSGTHSEVEPFPAGQVIIGRGAIIDAARWPKELLREPK